MKRKIFTLNGSKPMHMSDIFREVVSDYANKHPFLDAHQIRDIFVVVCRDVKIEHIVETAAEYNARSYQKSWERSADEITIPNGEKLYVSTQWRAGGARDNFLKFKDIVGKMGWGKIV